MAATSPGDPGDPRPGRPASPTGATIEPRVVGAVSQTPETTRILGAVLAALLLPGDVLLLSGGLGAGKTTFTQGLVAALGGDEAVTSPTFTLMRAYRTTPVVVHVDCWRLAQLDEVADLALEEILDEGGVAVVEWGEAAAPLIGSDALEVLFERSWETGVGSSGSEPAHENARFVQFVSTSATWTDRLDALATVLPALALERAQAPSQAHGPTDAPVDVR